MLTAAKGRLKRTGETLNAANVRLQRNFDKTFNRSPLEVCDDQAREQGVASLDRTGNNTYTLTLIPETIWRTSGLPFDPKVSVTLPPTKEVLGLSLRYNVFNTQTQKATQNIQVGTLRPTGDAAYLLTLYKGWWRYYTDDRKTYYDGAPPPARSKEQNGYIYAEVAAPPRDSPMNTLKILGSAQTGFYVCGSNSKSGPLAAVLSNPPGLPTDVGDKTETTSESAGASKVAVRKGGGEAIVLVDQGDNGELGVYDACSKPGKKDEAACLVATQNPTTMHATVDPRLGLRLTAATVLECLMLWGVDITNDKQIRDVCEAIAMKITRYALTATDQSRPPPTTGGNENGGSGGVGRGSDGGVRTTPTVRT